MIFVPVGTPFRNSSISRFLVTLDLQCRPKNHVDPFMPEFKADLLPRLSIKVAVNAIAVTTIDWCGVTCELLVMLEGVGRSQLMKTLQPMFIQRFTVGSTLCYTNAA